LMSDKPGRNKPRPAGISGSRSCTNIQTGVFAYQDIRIPNEAMLHRRPVKERLIFDRSTEAQRPSETGPPPTCPFISTNNVKEPTCLIPRNCCAGRRFIQLKETRNEDRPRRPSPLLWVGLYGGLPGPSTTFCRFVSANRPSTHMPAQSADSGAPAAHPTREAPPMGNRLAAPRSPWDPGTGGADCLVVSNPVAEAAASVAGSHLVVPADRAIPLATVRGPHLAHARIPI